MYAADNKDHVTSPLPVQAERDRDIVRQLKRETDSAARLQDKLRQATDRAAQLQRQLSKLQALLKQLSKQLTELVDFKKYYNAEHGRCVRIKSAVEKAWKLKSTTQKAK